MATAGQLGRRYIERFLRAVGWSVQPFESASKCAESIVEMEGLEFGRGTVVVPCPVFVCTLVPGKRERIFRA